MVKKMIKSKSELDLKLIKFETQKTTKPTSMLIITKFGYIKYYNNKLHRYNDLPDVIDNELTWCPDRKNIFQIY